ncbi:Response regulator protein VraR [compost metagenome]
MNKTLLYGFSLAALLFLLKWLELRYTIIDHAFQIYIGAIALIFTGLGIWLATKLSKPKVAVFTVEKEVYHDSNAGFTVNQQEINRLNLSKRELEVLELMAKGLSNHEIAASLFVSLNTIKTHSSRLFEKMEVKRRTQAIDFAKKTGIIP